jgi:hypothetical protein
LPSSIDRAILDLALGFSMSAGGDLLAGDVARALRRDVHAMSRTRLLKSALSATKSVSQLTSTRTPILPPLWM